MCLFYNFHTSFTLVLSDALKHIEVDCHYIHEAYDEKAITLPHIITDPQVVDIFTKDLPRMKHQFLVDKLLLVDLPTSI